MLFILSLLSVLFFINISTLNNDSMEKTNFNNEVTLSFDMQFFGTNNQQVFTYEEVSIHELIVIRNYRLGDFNYYLIDLYNDFNRATGQLIVRFDSFNVNDSFEVRFLGSISYFIVTSVMFMLYFNNVVVNYVEDLPPPVLPDEVSFFDIIFDYMRSVVNLLADNMQVMANLVLENDIVVLFLAFNFIFIGVALIPFLIKQLRK